MKMVLIAGPREHVGAALHSLGLVCSPDAPHRPPGRRCREPSRCRARSGGLPMEVSGRKYRSVKPQVLYIPLIGHFIQTLVQVS